MLLPQAFERGTVPEVLLAFDTEVPRILGGAAFRSRGDQFGLLQFRVVRPYRRRGFGTQLMRRVLAQALERGHAEVSIFTDTLANKEAEPFLTSHGFLRRGRMYAVETDAEQMLAEMARLRARLTASGRIPSGVRIVTPSEAPMHQVAELYNEYILRGRCIRPEFLEASFSDSCFRESSVILMARERVAGFIMAEWIQELALVPARVVIPEYRGGFANVLMMATALERGIAAGIRRVRFDSHEKNQDTLKLAKRFQAETVSVLDRFVRPLSPGERFDD